jgi:hypothetical protein
MNEPRKIIKSGKRKAGKRKLETIKITFFDDT